MTKNRTRQKIKKMTENNPSSNRTEPTKPPIASKKTEEIFISVQCCNSTPEKWISKNIINIISALSFITFSWQTYRLSKIQSDREKISLDERSSQRIPLYQDQTLENLRAVLLYTQQCIYARDEYIYEVKSQREKLVSSFENYEKAVKIYNCTSPKLEAIKELKEEIFTKQACDIDQESLNRLRNRFKEIPLLDQRTCLY